MSDIKYNIVDPMTVSYPFGVLSGEIPSATVKTQSQILQETTNAILNGSENNSETKEEFSMPNKVKRSSNTIKIGVVLIVLLVLLFGYIFK